MLSLRMGIYDQIVGLTSATSSLIDNYMIPQLNTETVGVQVFVRLTLQYSASSALTVNTTVTTNYKSYTTNFGFPIGSGSTQNKVVYNTTSGSEAATSVTINSITPSSDSNYNYIPSTP